MNMNHFPKLYIQLFFFYTIAVCLAVFSGCKQIEPERIVKVITDSITEITINSAISGGNILDDGGEPINIRGVCWNTSGNPTIQNYDGITANGSGDGRFKSIISGLTDGTTYYVRAYATNSNGTRYGDEIGFIAFECGNSIISDYDGNEYHTIQIGNQCWMKENLKATHYSDGTPIQLVVNKSAWSDLMKDEKAYCSYENSSSSLDVYGALYNWEAAMNNEPSSAANPSGRKGVCPDGWHLPSDDEWKELESYLGMSPSDADKIWSRGTNEGGQLKETGTSHWQSPNEGATNSSGFTALPGGYRLGNGDFSSIGNYASFWTSTMNWDYQYLCPWIRSLSHDRSDIHRGNQNTEDRGLSVRCLMDD